MSFESRQSCHRLLVRNSVVPSRRRDWSALRDVHGRVDEPARRCRKSGLCRRELDHVEAIEVGEPIRER